jgi:3-oxoacyl-[acyl-carrier protein] reductase
MDLGLDGKTALVAAASRGLGRAVAEELAAEGASLITRGEDALEATRAAIEGECGGRVVAVPADLSQPDQLHKVVDAGINEFGVIDILVTNTGDPQQGRLRAIPPKPGERLLSRIWRAFSISPGRCYRE